MLERVLLSVTDLFRPCSLQFLRMLLPVQSVSVELERFTSGAHLLHELGVWIDEVKFRTSTRFRNGEGSIESLYGGFYREGPVEHRDRAGYYSCQSDHMRSNTGFNLPVVELPPNYRLWPHLQIHDNLNTLLI